MALSRLKKKYKDVTPLVKEVELDGMTVKTPVVEIVFEKTSVTISRLPLIQKSIKPKNEEWFRLSQNSKVIDIICSESRLESVVRHMSVKPILIFKDFVFIWQLPVS